ncbi:MAG: RHS repeat-associated core domain-containing protein [Bacilli bacterium]|nr:hypothetical protein [Bacilli bacterium]
MYSNNYFYIKNLQNDIIGITNSNGNLIVTYVYDAYGNIVSITDTSGVNLGKINPFRFKSYYFDEETKFYYLNSRYYDPLIGRFINADDIGVLTEGELNLFAYCANNPVMHVDPNGYAWWYIAVGVVLIKHIKNIVMIHKAKREVDNMTNQEIDYYLESLDVKIIDSEIVTGRDLVSDKYDRIKALTAIKSKYNGTNSIYYMSAEWQGHNIVYPLTNNPANIDINSKDPRFTVRAGAYLLIALGVI